MTVTDRCGIFLRDLDDVVTADNAKRNDFDMHT